MLASFGIFINTIGLEQVKYTKRFTFDQTWLASGINLIVVVLGLFALSQAFLLLVEKDKSPKPQPVRGSLFSGMKELFGHKTCGHSLGVIWGNDGHDPGRRRIYRAIPLLYLCPQNIGQA